MSLYRNSSNVYVSSLRRESALRFLRSIFIFLVSSSHASFPFIEQHNFNKTTFKSDFLSSQYVFTLEKFNAVRHVRGTDVISSSSVSPSSKQAFQDSTLANRSLYTKLGIEYSFGAFGIIDFSFPSISVKFPLLIQPPISLNQLIHWFVFVSSHVATGGLDRKGFTCVAFDEIGRYVAVGREDSSLLIIDYPNRQHWALRVSRHTSVISACVSSIIFHDIHKPPFLTFLRFQCFFSAMHRLHKVDFVRNRSKSYRHGPRCRYCSTLIRLSWFKS